MDIVQIIMAAIICLALLTLLWQAKGRLLQACTGLNGNEKMTITVAVNGSSPCLENTASRLLWLKKNGDLPRSGVLIVDDGMDMETARAARVIADGNNEVDLCTPDQLEFFILRSCNDG